MTLLNEKHRKAAGEGYGAVGEEFAGGNRYPPPRLPMLPSISTRFATGGSSGDFTSAFWREDTAWCSRGCDALVLVIRHAHLASTDRVLVPTLHCPSIPVAIGNAGACPSYYRVNTDLTPRLDDVTRQLREGARALILIHYFGFRQDAKRYKDLCDQYGALLIEDCAHTLFGRKGQSLPGDAGHYAIASTRKLFPLPDGGAAISASGGLDPRALRTVTWTDESRRVVNSLQRAADNGLLGFLSGPTSSIFTFVDRMRRPARTISGPRLPSVRGDTSSSTGPRKMSRTAGYLMRSTGIERLTSIRRQNYAALAKGSRSLRGCRAVFPDLPADVVPYVFPLLLGDPARMFPALKQRQVPMYRWEGIHGLGCPVADEYESQLIQLPCHQELAAHDIAWILDQLSQVLGQTT